MQSEVVVCGYDLRKIEAEAIGSKVNRENIPTMESSGWRIHRLSGLKFYFHQAAGITGLSQLSSIAGVVPEGDSTGEINETSCWPL